MKINTVQAIGNEILIRISHDSPAPANDNAMVPFPFGVERNAARRLVRDGLTTYKVGRKRYARQSDLDAAINALASVAKPAAGTRAQHSLAADDVATPKRGRK